MAVGYAQGHGCPYMRAISKYTPTWPRSFTPSNQETRNLVAKMKLIANRDVLQGKRVLFCDDSIVRGTQLRDNTKVLHELGAKEVHMRIGCPPLVYSCPFVNYSASKAGVIGMTKAAAKELGRRHIRVNAIAPGFIETDMTAALTDEQKEAAAKNIGLGRLGQPADIANCALFLASDMSDYITGQVIGVDGGLII